MSMMPATPWLMASSAGELEALALALELGQLGAPYSALALERALGRGARQALDELVALDRAGLSPAALALTARMMARQRRAQDAQRARVSLVWTGPEVCVEESRDTQVVVRELFEQAQRDLLIVGYAFYQGQTIFAPVAQRMSQDPSFRVRFCVHITRSYGDHTSEDDALVQAHMRDFKAKQWPLGAPAPQVYYDPRTVARGVAKRASLHAKCIVVDHARALITSANFTEAAYTRNIEAGVLVEDPYLAQSLVRQFDHLIAAEVLTRAPW